MIQVMTSELTYMRKTASPDATKQLAATLAPCLHAGDVVVLTGDLGAGKTQFVQGVAEGLGIRVTVTSPTFNILLSYLSGTLPLYHFDLYRLEHPDELEDTGIYETIEGDGASFIEWGEKFPSALPSDCLEVSITTDDENSRTIRASASGNRACQLLSAWAQDCESNLVKK